MNIENATIEAFVNVLKEQSELGNLTLIPIAQIYKENENAVGSESEDGTTSKRLLPCIIVVCDDPKEVVAYTGQYMSHPVVEVHCSADQKTDAQFDAILEQVSNCFFDQTQTPNTPVDPNFLPQLLTNALTNFTSQYARMIGQSQKTQDRRWVGTFNFEVCSAQSDFS